MKLYNHKTIGGILLIAGTAVGAGMLALPITTGVGGFYNALGLFLCCFAYMLVTLFLLLEAVLYEESMEANIISMSKKRLGSAGQIISWLSFLLLLYSVAAAYLSAGGSLVAKFIGSEISNGYTQYGIYIFAAFFCMVVYFGAWLVDYINRFLMLALITTYISMVIFITPHVSAANLTGGEPKYLLGVVTVVILSFTSHIIVPSLRIYMKNNISQLKRTLLIGSLIPLIFYVVWELLIVGLLPVSEGEFSLKAIASGPHPVAMLTKALDLHLHKPWIASVVGSFSFLALVTSFLAVMLSLVDFLSDGLQISKTTVGSLFLLLFAVVPPLIFAIYYPQGFVMALRYAGLCVAILYGILPALMVWQARYIENKKGEFVVPGGKITLVLVMVGALAVIYFQIASAQGWLPKL